MAKDKCYCGVEVIKGSVCCEKHTKKTEELNDGRRQAKIKKLMDNHLIGWYEPADKAMKAHYRISVENMVAFLDKYFEVK